MDYDAFSGNAWCSGSDGWTQAPSEHVEITWTRLPTNTGIFYDENTSHLWNMSSAPLIPNTPSSFGYETGLINEPSFSDSFSHASCDIGALFGHESDSGNWNANWSGENSWGLGTEYTVPSSSDCSASFPTDLEAYLAMADPSLAAGSVTPAADSPPLYLWGSDDLTVSSSSPPTVDLTQHEMSNSEAQSFLGWDWHESSTRWLDEGVSSEVCHFAQQIKVSERTKVSHVERVTGLPSQFPIPLEATAFLINVTNIPDLDLGSTVDALLKDQNSEGRHSWGGSTGSRSKVDAYVPGIFFGCADPKRRVACRRAKPKCCGAYSCESLASEFTDVERRVLDPNSRDRLIEAQLRAREIQDSSRTGQVLSFIKSISDWRCGAVDSATNRACSGGKAVPKKLAQRRRNKDFILVCSHRDMIQCPTGHRTLEIPDQIDQELFLKAANGEKIVEDEDQEDECSKVYSSRQGKKAFNHIKDGRSFEAKVLHLPCEAELTVFIPHEDKHPELARMCIVIPDHKKPHRHPVPPPLKVPHAIAAKYKACVRKLGLGATVAKVEKALSTKEILGGLTPSLYHLGLVSRDAKIKLINEVKSEPGNQTRHENQTVEMYIAEQRSLPDEDRYIYVSEREGRVTIFGIKHGIIKYIHKVRTLDCDTTFKPVVGKTNVYEINGWMPGINAEVTLGRVWIKFHDRRSFQFVWEELSSLVKRLTAQKLGFMALHRGGTLLGVNADMEPAPLLGMGDALLPTIDIPSVAEEVKETIGVLKKIVRSCYSHVKRGIPDISPLSREDQDRINNFMYMETPEDVEEFKIWIRTLPDPDGVLMRWWDHKEMHEWLLPGVIQCLSDMDPDVWHIIEATTNFGEAQHAANNAQTGIGMGTVQSFIEYDKLDTRRAAEIEIMLKSGNLHNPRNEVSNRYASRNARRVHATEKAKHARVADEELQAAEQAVVDAQAQLKQIRAESKIPPLIDEHYAHAHPDDHGNTKDSRCRDSTVQNPLNASTSAASGAVPDETTPASTVITTAEQGTRPTRKRSGSTSLESGAPPKRLKLGPLKGWGVERHGVNMSAVEYAQKHWSEFQDEYPELLTAVLPDDK
ncbi:hypothetical protein C8R44DRAFT_927220 [Mycena epipterygia]|nr:hypothetical protein C8R44DRAFT_927220 [Mycena epipterygia]